MKNTLSILGACITAAMILYSVIENNSHAAIAWSCCLLAELQWNLSSKKD